MVYSVNNNIYGNNNDNTYLPFSYQNQPQNGNKIYLKQQPQQNNQQYTLNCQNNYNQLNNYQQINN